MYNSSVVSSKRGKNKESHRDSHSKDMSPSTRGMNYRSACDNTTRPAEASRVVNIWANFKGRIHRELSTQIVCLPHEAHDGDKLSC